MSSTSTSAAAEAEFPIEELSRRTGVTVRSLRSYQSRKLLPPPVVRGRTGWYAEAHVARVRLIQELQAEGMKLDGIARLLERTGADEQQLLQFTQSVRSMFGDSSRPRVTTLEELAERFGASEPSLIARAVRLGLLRDLGDGTFEETHPDLLTAGEAAMRVLQLSPDEALDVLAELRQHADGVAKVYVELFVERVWSPFVEAGAPSEQWTDMQRSVDELRDLATSALRQTFETVMAERVDEAVGRELAKDPGRSKGRKRRGRRR